MQIDWSYECQDTHIWNAEVQVDGKVAFGGDLNRPRLKALREMSRDKIVVVLYERGDPAYIFAKGMEFKARQNHGLSRVSRDLTEKEVWLKENKARLQGLREAYEDASHQFRSLEDDIKDVQENYADDMSGRLSEDMKGLSALLG